MTKKTARKTTKPAATKRDVKVELWSLYDSAMARCDRNLALSVLAEIARIEHDPLAACRIA